MARCTATTTRGTRCKNTTKNGSEVCARHSRAHPNTAGSEATGSDLVRQHHAEDLAWGMLVRGSNYSQIARTLAIDGVHPYADATSVRRATERAAKRHTPQAERDYHRAQQDAVFNDLIQRMYLEVQRLQESQVDRIMVQTDGMDSETRAGLIAAAQAADAERLPNLVKVTAEIRKLETELARLWGTRLERKEVDMSVSVLQTAPIDLARLSRDERKRMLELVAEDMQRRAKAIPAEVLA